MLSIVTSTFNDGNYVPGFLDSIAPLLGDSASLIVVDSFSTDGSERLFERPHVTVLRKKCTLGTGRNFGVAHSDAEFILIVDSDNSYHRLPLMLQFPPKGTIRVGIDSRYRNAWFALGHRADFVAHPFVDQGGPGSGGGAEDLYFFSRAPVEISVYDGLATDLKRAREPGRRDDLRSLFRFRNGWFQSGLTWKDVATLLARMARAPGGRRYFASDAGVVAAHILTLGRAGRRPPLPR